jgi:hypothetical protein
MGDIDPVENALEQTHPPTLFFSYTSVVLFFVFVFSFFLWYLETA